MDCNNHKLNMQPAQLGELTDPGRIEAFLARYPGQVCKDYDSTRLKCGIITLDELQLAAQLLRDGELVAFPTETVYGLGANALNADAVTNIFRTKRRPLTDPVIVHLHNPAIITKYVSDCTHLDLGLQFWPGPFTLVLKANLETLQTTQLLSASTGFVGFRVPHNDVALKLLELSGVPVGAPSANIFSHVSPTSPIHVFNDFYDQRVFIIDGPQCQNGIESTVAKVVDNEIRVLRRGSLSLNSLIAYVASSQRYQGYSVTVVNKVVAENEQSETPGALLKHYSPLVPTYILNIKEGGSKLEPFNVGNAVVIDFNKHAQSHIGELEGLTYGNLSQHGDLEEAMHNFYSALRWAENQNVAVIYIVDLCEASPQVSEDTQTLADKIYRSASGQRVVFDLSTRSFVQ